MTLLPYWELLLSTRCDRRPARSSARPPRRISLRTNESVIMVTHPSRILALPKYLLTLGLYGIWRKRHTYVVTDQRLMIGQGVVNRRERAIPMRRIEGVSFLRRGAGAFCEIESLTGGGREVDTIGPISSRDARRMVSAIESHT